jgi:hypothetical protein
MAVIKDPNKLQECGRIIWHHIMLRTSPKTVDAEWRYWQKCSGDGTDREEGVRGKLQYYLYIEASPDKWL